MRWRRFERPGREPHRRHLFKRVVRYWPVLLIVAVITLIAIPTLVGRIIARKLKHEIESRLSATLDYGSALYLPPYGLRIDHASLMTNSSESSLPPIFQVGRLELHLRQLPIGHGPLMIDRIEIRRPVVRLLNLSDGLSSPALVSSDAPAAKATATAAATTAPAGATKLSDLFRLDHLSITEGSLEYEDRSTTPAVAPVTWAAINADVKLAPVGPGKYQFDVSADHAPLATAKMAGELDIDSMLLHLSKFVLNVQTATNQPPVELPTPLRKLCAKFGIGGDLALTGVATVPLNEPTRAYFAAELRLKDGSCRVDGFDRPLSPVRGVLKFGNLPDEGSKNDSLLLGGDSPAAIPVQFRLTDFAIDCGRQFLHVDHAFGSIDAASQSWTLRELSGLVDAGGGAGPVADAKVWMRLPFTAAGSGHFSAADPYWAVLTVSDGQALASDQKLPLRHVNFDLYARPRKLELRGCKAEALAGKLSADADLVLSATKSYSGKVSIEHANVRQAADLFLTDEQDRQRISGIASFHAGFSGVVSANGPATGPDSIEDRLVATGDFSIHDGDFYHIPMLKDVVARMNLPNAADIGEAAATFDVRHRQVMFYNVTANSDAVGVQGNGTISFAGIADMTLIATPLSDWREKLQRSHIQYLQDLGADIAAKAEAGFNTVQRIALYQFRLTGPLSKPDVKAVPLPVETKAVQTAFEKMAALRDKYRPR